MSHYPIFGIGNEMGDIICFNNKLRFLKSVPILTVLIFLGIANDGKTEAHSEE
jgi:hypothetical protein